MLLVVKFRNQIHRLNPALQVDMRNTRINGVARGCYGYITDPATGPRYRGGHGRVLLCKRAWVSRE